MILILDYEIKNVYWESKPAGKSMMYSLVKCEKCDEERTVVKYYAEKKESHLCIDCSLTGKTRERKILEKDYNDLAQERNLKLIDFIIPLNARIRIQWKCVEGHIFYQCYSEINRGRGCPYCSGHGISKTLEDYINLSNRLNIKFIDLVPDKIRTKVKWICKCGEIFEASYDTLRRNKLKSVCDDCFYKLIIDPNLTEEDRIKGRLMEENRDWSNNIRKIYQKICQKCFCGFSRDNFIHAHHIYNYATFPKLRFEISNGITLCSKCHYKFHGDYGKEGNNLNQLEEFLGRKLNDPQRSNLLNLINEQSNLNESSKSA